MSTPRRRQSGGQHHCCGRKGEWLAGHFREGLQCEALAKHWTWGWRGGFTGCDHLPAFIRTRNRPDLDISVLVAPCGNLLN